MLLKIHFCKIIFRNFC